MPKRYPRELRRVVCERLLPGESISALANEMSLSAATLHRWKKQALINHDVIPGVKSVEVDELALVQRTIEELLDTPVPSAVTTGR
jgi:transposase-like protein